MVVSMIPAVNGSANALPQPQGLDRNTRTKGAAPDETEQTRALSAEEEMAAFKRDFYAEVAKIQIHNTVKNVALNVSEEAFRRMKEDPQYKEEVLGLLRRDLEAPFIHDVSSLITIGGTRDEYIATAWSVTADDDFWARSQNSHFIKKTSGRGADQNDYSKYWAEMAKKRHLLEYRRQIELQNREVLENKLEAARLEEAMLQKKATEQYERNSYNLSTVVSPEVTVDSQK